MFNPLAVFFSKDKALLKSINNIFGFYPSNIFLYKQALRHKSVIRPDNSNKQISNERLEYLGDAVLGCVVAEYLFRKFPARDEGFLTEMRSKIVNRDQLNKLCERLNLHTLIRFEGQNGRHYKSVKGDAFEAFIGATYLDKGYHFTRKLIIGRIIQMFVDVSELEKTEFNFKSKLIEYAQREKVSLEFKVVSISGRDTNKLYAVNVFVDDSLKGEGRDHSIKKAEQAAAEDALQKLQLDLS